MKALFFLVIIIFISIYIFPQEFEQNIMYVNSRSGLRVRSEPSINSSIIGVLQYGEFIIISSLSQTRSQNQVTIDGIKDYWYRIDFRIDNNWQTGWIFGGYLSDRVPNDLPFFIGRWNTIDKEENFIWPPEFYYFDVKNNFYAGIEGSGAGIGGTWRLNDNVVLITLTGYNMDTGEAFILRDHLRYRINIIDYEIIIITNLNDNRHFICKRSIGFL